MASTSGPPPRDPSDTKARGAMFSPIVAGRMSALIVEQIELLIREGQLVVGDRLPSERDLCERFGVSRVTVREALRVLEANGLILIRVGARGGAFVSAPTSERVGAGIANLMTLSAITPTEVTEARRVFELGIVHLMCERADEQDIAELLEICDRSDRAVSAGDYPVSLSAEFHVRAARATHNAAIEMLVQSFHGPLLMSLQRAQLIAPLMGHVGSGEHRLFVEAVARRDADAARQVMSIHLARTAERLEAAERDGDQALISS